eukprot:2850851-Amphidinium_carterae.1
MRGTTVRGNRSSSTTSTNQFNAPKIALHIGFDEISVLYVLCRVSLVSMLAVLNHLFCIKLGLVEGGDKFVVDHMFALIDIWEGFREWALLCYHG